MSRRTPLLWPLALFSLSALVAGCSGCDESTLPGPSTGQTLDGRSIAELVTPFDVSRRDLVGPNTHAAMYGQRPRIIAVPDGQDIDVLIQDEGVDSDAGQAPRAVLIRLTPSGETYGVATALEVPFLDRVMGLARAEDGDYFIASGIEENAHRELSVDYPASNQYRSNVVRVHRLAPDGTVRFDVDLDLARRDAHPDNTPEQLINPMTASSARLAYGGGQLALVHGINTDPDSNGTRHQKAITTLLDATDGSVLRTSSMWVSHSFDQRVFHDGSGFMELHLGDAYPRQVVFDRVSADARSGSYPAFFIKGNTGNNNTFTRLGDIAPIENGGQYGYLVLFASERNTELPSEGRVNGERDLGLVRVRADFADLDGSMLEHLDPAMPHTQDVTSGGNERQNRLRFLTDHGATGGLHAERPKLVPIGGDLFVVLFERWQTDDQGQEFLGTFAMLIDAQGDTVVGETELGAIHLPRGDDAFPLESGAAWITGDEVERSLTIHHVTRSGDTLVLNSSLVP